MTTTQPIEGPAPTAGPVGRLLGQSVDGLVAGLLDVNGLDDLTPAEVLDEAIETVRLRRAVTVREMLVAAHWADRHGQPVDERDPVLTLGGEGTPGVREYALPELAMAHGVHTATTRALLATPSTCATASR